MSTTTAQNNSNNSNVIYKLDNGVLSKIMNNQNVEKPKLQVLNIRNINTNGNQNDRYLILLSDGDYFESACLLLPNLNNYVKDKQLKKESIIQLDKYALNSIQNGKVLVIVDLTIICNEYPKIGNPVALTQKTNKQQLQKKNTTAATTMTNNSNNNNNNSSSSNTTKTANNDTNNNNNNDNIEEICKCTHCQDKNTILLCYKMLGLNENATKDEVRTRYIHLANENNEKVQNDSKLAEKFDIMTKAYTLIMGMKSCGETDDEIEHKKCDHNVVISSSSGNNHQRHHHNHNTPYHHYHTHHKVNNNNNNHHHHHHHHHNCCFVSGTNTNNSNTTTTTTIITNGSSAAGDDDDINDDNNKSKSKSKIKIPLEDFLQYAWLKAADECSYDTDSDSECDVGFHRRKNRNPKAFYQQMKKNNKTLSIKAMKKRAKEVTTIQNLNSNELNAKTSKLQSNTKSINFETPQTTTINTSTVKQTNDTTNKKVESNNKKNNKKMDQVNETSNNNNNNKTLMNDLNNISTKKVNLNDKSQEITSVEIKTSKKKRNKKKKKNKVTEIQDNNRINNQLPPPPPPPPQPTTSNLINELKSTQNIINSTTSSSSSSDGLNNKIKCCNIYHNNKHEFDEGGCVEVVKEHGDVNYEDEEEYEDDDDDDDDDIDEDDDDDVDNEDGIEGDDDDDDDDDDDEYEEENDDEDGMEGKKYDAGVEDIISGKNNNKKIKTIDKNSISNVNSTTSTNDVAVSTIAANIENLTTAFITKDDTPENINLKEKLKNIVYSLQSLQKVIDTQDLKMLTKLSTKLVDSGDAKIIENSNTQKCESNASEHGILTSNFITNIEKLMSTNSSSSSSSSSSGVGVGVSGGGGSGGATPTNNGSIIMDEYGNHLNNSNLFGCRIKNATFELSSSELKKSHDMLLTELIQKRNEINDTKNRQSMRQQQHLQQLQQKHQETREKMSEKDLINANIILNEINPTILDHLNELKTITLSTCMSHIEDFKINCKLLTNNSELFVDEDGKLAIKKQHDDLLNNIDNVQTLSSLASESLKNYKIDQQQQQQQQQQGKKKNKKNKNTKNVQQQQQSTNTQSTVQSQQKQNQQNNKNQTQSTQQQTKQTIKTNNKDKAKSKLTEIAANKPQQQQTKKQSTPPPPPPTVQISPQTTSTTVTNIEDEKKKSKNKKKKSKDVDKKQSKTTTTTTSTTKPIPVIKVTNEKPKSSSNKTNLSDLDSFSIDSVSSSATSLTHNNKPTNNNSNYDTISDIIVIENENTMDISELDNESNVDDVLDHENQDIDQEEGDDDDDCDEKERECNNNNNNDDDAGDWIQVNKKQTRNNIINATNEAINRISIKNQSDIQYNFNNKFPKSVSYDSTRKPLTSTNNNNNNTLDVNNQETNVWNRSNSVTNNLNMKSNNASFKTTNKTLTNNEQQQKKPVNNNSVVVNSSNSSGSGCVVAGNNNDNKKIVKSEEELLDLIPKSIDEEEIMLKKALELSLKETEAKQLQNDNKLNINEDAKITNRKKKFDCIDEFNTDIDNKKDKNKPTPIKTPQQQQQQQQQQNVNNSINKNQNSPINSNNLTKTSSKNSKTTTTTINTQINGNHLNETKLSPQQTSTRNLSSNDEQQQQQKKLTNITLSSSYKAGVSYAAKSAMKINDAIKTGENLTATTSNQMSNFISVDEFPPVSVHNSINSATLITTNETTSSITKPQTIASLFSTSNRIVNGKSNSTIKIPTQSVAPISQESQTITNQESRSISPFKKPLATNKSLLNRPSTTEQVIESTIKIATVNNNNNENVAEIRSENMFSPLLIENIPSSAPIANSVVSAITPLQSTFEPAIKLLTPVDGNVKATTSIDIEPIVEIVGINNKVTSSVIAPSSQNSKSSTSILFGDFKDNGVDLPIDMTSNTTSCVDSPKKAVGAERPIGFKSNLPTAIVAPIGTASSSSTTIIPASSTTSSTASIISPSLPVNPTLGSLVNKTVGSAIGLPSAIVAPMQQQQQPSSQPSPLLRDVILNNENLSLNMVQNQSHNTIFTKTPPPGIVTSITPPLTTVDNSLKYPQISLANSNLKLFNPLLPTQATSFDAPIMQLKQQINKQQQQQQMPLNSYYDPLLGQLNTTHTASNPSLMQYMKNTQMLIQPTYNSSSPPINTSPANHQIAFNVPQFNAKLMNTNFVNNNMVSQSPSPSSSSSPSSIVNATVISNNTNTNANTINNNNNVTINPIGPYNKTKLQHQQQQQQQQKLNVNMNLLSTQNQTYHQNSSTKLNNTNNNSSTSNGNNSYLQQPNKNLVNQMNY